MVESRQYQSGLSQAANGENYGLMVRVFRDEETQADMSHVCSMLFIHDLKYARADIVLALKTVELEKGWR